MTIQNISNLPSPANAASNGTIGNNVVPSNAATSDSKAVTATPIPAQAAEPSITEVQQAANKVRRIVQMMASNLEFSVDQASGRTVVKLTDVQTGDTIRQIPSQEMLDLARDIGRFQGILLKDRA